MSLNLRIIGVINIHAGLNAKLLLLGLTLGLAAIGLFEVPFVQPARAQGGRTNFTFMVLLNRSVVGVDQIIFNGHGSFNSAEVEGGGSFTRFTPCATPPW